MERDVLHKILEALVLLDVWCWRTNSGVARGANGARIRLAPKGTPDILGALSSGRMFGLETKDPEGKKSDQQLTEAQLTWRSRAQARGVRHARTLSVEEAVEAIKAWEKLDARP